MSNTSAEVELWIQQAVNHWQTLVVNETVLQISYGVWSLSVAFNCKMTVEPHANQQTDQPLCCKRLLRRHWSYRHNTINIYLQCFPFRTDVTTFCLAFLLQLKNYCSLLRMPQHGLFLSYVHVTIIKAAVIKLHWLPVVFRIRVKMTAMVYLAHTGHCLLISVKWSPQLPEISRISHHALPYVLSLLTTYYREPEQFLLKTLSLLTALEHEKNLVTHLRSAPCIQILKNSTPTVQCATLFVSNKLLMLKFT